MEKNSSSVEQALFSPMLYMKDVAAAIEFYKKAFDAVELRRWSNDDGSVHVAEMSLRNHVFHLHEEVEGKNQRSPAASNNATTVVIGLFVQDVDDLMHKAINAGANLLDPPQDYDYGYRQATITDPFGHQWQLQKVI